MHADMLLTILTNVTEYWQQQHLWLWLIAFWRHVSNIILEETKQNETIEKWQ